MADAVTCSTSSESSGSGSCCWLVGLSARRSGDVSSCQGARSQATTRRQVTSMGRTPAPAPTTSSLNPTQPISVGRAVTSMTDAATVRAFGALSAKHEQQTLRTRHELGRRLSNALASGSTAAPTNIARSTPYQKAFQLSSSSPFPSRETSKPIQATLQLVRGQHRSSRAKPALSK